MYCKLIAEQKLNRMFFHGSKDIFLESVQQLERIKKLAEQYDFDMGGFVFYEYGAAKLKELVDRIEKEINSELAYSFAFSLINGAAHWSDVLSDLNILKLIHNRCAEALAKDKEKNLADIVWLEMRRLNNRLPEWGVGDDENRNLHGLLSRIRRGVARGKETLADCKPLTVLFYLTMLGFGQKTKLYLANCYDKKKGKEGEHLRSGVEIDGQEVFYENRAVYYENRNKLMIEGLYNIRTVDIWAVLAEEIVTKLKEPLLPKDYTKPELRVTRKPLSEGDPQSIAVLEQARILDRNSTSVLALLLEKYEIANELFRGKYVAEILDTMQEIISIFHEEFCTNENTRDQTTKRLNSLYAKLLEWYKVNKDRFDLSEAKNFLDELSKMPWKN